MWLGQSCRVQRERWQVKACAMEGLFVGLGLAVRGSLLGGVGDRSPKEQPWVSLPPQQVGLGCSSPG